MARDQSITALTNTSINTWFRSALDQQGKIISITQAVARRAECQQHRYYCPDPDCGHPLIVVAGTERVHHFRHVEHRNCSNESLQHILGKQRIILAITEHHQICLQFPCHFCGKHQFIYTLPATINRAISEYNYPDTGFRGDVAVFEEYEKTNPFLMFEVYHPHHVDSVKKSGISRWVELSADTLLNEQPDTILHYWQVLDASSSRKPRICDSCQPHYANFHDVQARLSTLLEQYKSLTRLYQAYATAFTDPLPIVISDIAQLLQQAKIIQDDYSQRDHYQQIIRIIYELISSPASQFFMTPSQTAQSILTELVPLLSDSAKKRLWKGMFNESLESSRWRIEVATLLAVKQTMPAKMQMMRKIEDMELYRQTTKTDIFERLEKAQGNLATIPRAEMAKLIVKAYQMNLLAQLTVQYPELMNPHFLAAAVNEGFYQTHFKVKLFYQSIKQLARGKENVLKWIEEHSHTENFGTSNLMTNGATSKEKC